MYDLILDSPELQTLTQRRVTIAITAMGWLLWSYCSFPFISLCGWLLDFEACSNWIKWLGGQHYLIATLKFYAITVCLALCFWGVWCSVSYLISKLKKTRRDILAVSNQDLSERFDIAIKTLTHAQRAELINFYFDESGEIATVEPIGNKI